MKPEELITKLRTTKTESKRLMLDEAADLIEQMLSDLKRFDHECGLCRNAKTTEFCEAASFDPWLLCDRCEADCVCRECDFNSKWEYRGFVK